MKRGLIMITNNVTVTINDQTVTADMATIAALLDMVVESGIRARTPNRRSPTPRGCALHDARIA